MGDNRGKSSALLWIVRPKHFCSSFGGFVVTLAIVKELPQKWADYLHDRPETGMDYQVVAVTLRDGRRIEDVTIVHSHIIGGVRGQKGVPFEPDDITDIEVTHRKWNFRRE